MLNKALVLEYVITFLRNSLILKIQHFERHKCSVYLTGDPGYDPPI